MMDDELVRALRLAVDRLTLQARVVAAARSLNEHTFKEGKVVVSHADRKALMDALAELEQRSDHV